MSQINYVDDLVNELSDSGLNQDLKDVLDNDTRLLSDLNVANDRQRNLAFYLDNFCDDLCEEFGYSIKDNYPVIVKSFNYLKNSNDVDLTKIRAAVLKSLRELGRKKVAYPNTTGVSETNIQPERDVSKWVKALGQIYEAMKNGEDRESVVKRVTEGWGPMVKHDFEAWARYYEKGDHEKYNVKTASHISIQQLLDEGDEFPEDIEQPEELPKVSREKTPDDFKKSLLSRLNSAERLLYNFVHVWPDHVYNRLHQGLSDLKREITMMRTVSSIQDVIIRTASVWEYNGFVEGAKELRKIAQPPGDITSEIERALTGREFEEKSTIKEESEVPDMGEGMGEDMGEGMIPPEEEMPPEGAEMPPLPPEEQGSPPAGVEDTMPPEEVPPGPEPELAPKDNPFAAATVQDVLEILEPLSQKLREREFIRDLSKVDMMLDSLNIASHFPELGEAQAKALELNIYVGTRVERVIGKLKGGLKEDKDEKDSPVAPDIEMEELGEKKGPEETVFEVAEEGGPPPEMPSEGTAPPETSTKEPSLEVPK